MVGAMHDTRRQASRAGLLIAAAAFAACAKVQPPPGGPPDAEPPVLLAATPDSGSAISGFSDAAVFQFNEIITERSLDQFVRVSPRHEEIRVTWRRHRLTVRPGGGWLPNTVYFITLLPGITDLRNNRWEEEHTLVFTTGDELPDTKMSGLVVNWEAGQRAVDGLVEAIRVEDSLTYTTRTDSTGAFSFSMLPPGSYALVATIDDNRNDRRGFREPFDSTLIDLADSAVDTLWTARRDTVGPKVSEVSLLDSMAVVVQFDQTLDTVFPTVDSFTLWQLPDSVLVRPARIVSRDVFLEERALAAQSDSSQASPDSSAQVEVPELPPEVSDPEPAEEVSTQEEDHLVTARPTLLKEIVLIMAEPLRGGIRYWVEGSVANVAGVLETSGRQLNVPERDTEPEPGN